MAQDIGRVLLHHPLSSTGISQVEFDESGAGSDVLADPSTKVIDADDIMAGSAQPIGHMPAYEASSTSYQDLHTRLRAGLSHNGTRIGLPPAGLAPSRAPKAPGGRLRHVGRDDASQHHHQ
jgi:hypothetical protein